MEVKGHATFYSHSPLKPLVRVNININIDILQTPVKIHIYSDYMRIERKGIDYEGDTNLFCRYSKNVYGTTICKDLPKRKFLIDSEDSDIDNIYIYFEE